MKVNGSCGHLALPHTEGALPFLLPRQEVNREAERRVHTHFEVCCSLVRCSEHREH